MQTTLHSLQPPHLPPNLTSLVTLAPDLLKKKKIQKTWDHFKAPQKTMSNFCIHCSVDRGERALGAGSYSREWKGRGVKGVNATQREVRKGKLAIHEALGRGHFFGGWVGRGVHSGAMNNKYLTHAKGSPKSLYGLLL